MYSILSIKIVWNKLNSLIKSINQRNADRLLKTITKHAQG